MSVYGHFTFHRSFVTVLKLNRTLALFLQDLINHASMKNTIRNESGWFLCTVGYLSKSLNWPKATQSRLLAGLKKLGYIDVAWDESSCQRWITIDVGKIQTTIDEKINAGWKECNNGDDEPDNPKLSIDEQIKVIKDTVSGGFLQLRMDILRYLQGNTSAAVVLAYVSNQLRMMAVHDNARLKESDLWMCCPAQKIQKDLCIGKDKQKHAIDTLEKTGLLLKDNRKNNCLWVKVNADKLKKIHEDYGHKIPASKKQARALNKSGTEELTATAQELKTMPYQLYLQTDHWQSMRKAAMANAQYRCQVCNTNNDTLDVHHRTYERRGREHPSDLTVLCRYCHETYHGVMVEED